MKDHAPAAAPRTSTCSIGPRPTRAGFVLPDQRNAHGVYSSL